MMKNLRINEVTIAAFLLEGLRNMSKFSWLEHSINATNVNIKDGIVSIYFIPRSTTEFEIRKEMVEIISCIYSFFNEDNKIIQFKIDLICAEAKKENGEILMQVVSSLKAAKEASEGNIMGWQNNSKIVSMTPEHLLSTLDKILFHFEKSFRKFIKEALICIYDTSWEDYIPMRTKLEKIRNNAIRSKDSSKDSELLEFLLFPEYWQVINKNWDNVFVNYFPNKDFIRSRLQEFNPIRREKAHYRVPQQVSINKAKRLTEEILYICSERSQSVKPLKSYIIGIYPLVKGDDYDNSVINILNGFRLNIVKMKLGEISQNEFVESIDIMRKKLEQIKNSVPPPSEFLEVHSEFIRALNLYIEGFKIAIQVFVQNKPSLITIFQHKFAEAGQIINETKPLVEKVRKKFKI